MFFPTQRVADPRRKGNRNQERKEGRNIDALPGAQPCAPAEEKEKLLCGFDGWKSLFALFMPVW